MGLAYLALSAHAGAPLLTDDQVNRGTIFTTRDLGASIVFS